MILPELSSLPKSASSGPETWGEAFGRVVDTSDQVMVAVENVTASQDNFHAAYQSYIDEVEQATGERLQNPMDVDIQTGTFQDKRNPTFSFETGNEWREERRRVAMDRFEAQRQALAQKYPAQAGLISLDIDGRVTKRMRQAEQASLEALQSPELGMAGRFAAQIVGGLKGSARDPYQWAMAVIGGGAGTARTVAGRIGQVMLTEALINGGSEAVLQAASQERKARAGLEHGLNDALKNVGIAATFGSLFGGVAQGGAELARIFKLGEGGDALAARVLDGRPEPGDVETLAKAMNVELSPERLDLLTRSFEERVLDEVTIPQDGNPATMRVYEAALRHAEDPDNFPAPELVERVVAEEEAGRLLTLTPEQYERFYGGDPNTIDDIADTFFAEDMDAAGRRIDAMAMRVDEIGTKVDAMARKADSAAPVTAPAAEAGPPLDAEKPAYLDTRAGGARFHGSRDGLPDGGLDDYYYSELNYYGQGFYTTDAIAIADGYAKGQRENIVQVREKKDVRAFDMEQPIPDWLVEADDDFFQAVIREVKPKNVRELYDGVREVGSLDMMSADAIQEYFDALRWRFEQQGYEALDHVGGLRTGKKPHAVRIYFAPGSTVEIDARAVAGYLAPEPKPPVPEPLEAQRIRPDQVAEPLDDAAMRAAEVEAGDLIKPEIDANGNPKSLLDYIAVEDGDGNYRLMPARQALDEADEPAMLADLLESCKL